MLAADAPWWMGEWGHLPHNANDNRPNGTGANADNFPQPPNTTENTYRGANFSPSNRPSPDYTGRLPEPGYGPYRPPTPQATPGYTGRLPEPFYGPQRQPSRLPEPFYGPRGQPNPPAPQTPPGGWMYNKTNPAPSFSPVLPTPKPAPPRPGQAQSGPPPASQYEGPHVRAGGPGGPGGSITPVGNFTPLPGYREGPRGVPSVPSFGLGSKPVSSPTRDGLAQYDPTGSSNRQAWKDAGRPGLPTDSSFAQVSGRAQDGTAFGTQAEASFYDKWRASGGQASAPAQQQFGPPQAAQPPQGRAPVPSFGPAPGDRPKPSFSPFDPKNPNKQYDEMQAWVATMPKNSRGDPYGTMYAMDVGTSRPTSRAPAASPRPPAPSMRTADRYTRPEGYVPNSTLWAQHAPTPEPEQAPYNPNPPKAPRPNVIPKMQMGPSSSYLASPGYSTQATWDQSQGKMGQASYSGAMTMNANMANPGGESMRPQGLTFTAKGVDGKQYANPADAMARRDALITNLGQQQARYSGSMGRNLGAPQFNMKQAMGQENSKPNPGYAGNEYANYSDAQMAAYNAAGGTVRYTSHPLDVNTGVGDEMRRNPYTGQIETNPRYR